MTCSDISGRGQVTNATGPICTSAHHRVVLIVTVSNSTQIDFTANFARLDWGRMHSLIPRLNPEPSYPPLCSNGLFTLLDIGVVILTDPPPLFLGPPGYFDCCEWDPFVS